MLSKGGPVHDVIADAIHWFATLEVTLCSLKCQHENDVQV